MADGFLPTSFRAVAFDLDGVLIDTEPVFEEAVVRLLSRRGHQLRPGTMQSMMGTPAEESLVWLRDSYRLAEPVAELIAERTTLFYGALADHPATLLPGVVRVLDWLDGRGTPRAIATSSTPAHVERVFGPFGLLPRFAFVLTCEDVKQGKPEPEIYQLAAARLGVATHELLVVEDSPNGLRAAKSAGALCLFIPRSPMPPEYIEMADAVAVDLHALLPA